MKKRHNLQLTLLVMSLASCSTKPKEDVTAQLSYNPDMKAIFLTVENRSKEPVCFLNDNLNTAFDDTFSIYQNSVRLQPDIFNDPDVINYKNTNVTNGITVVPKLRRVFAIDLSHFKVKPQMFRARLVLRIANCADFFSNEKTLWTTYDPPVTAAFR